VIFKGSNWDNLRDLLC